MMKTIFLAMILFNNYAIADDDYWNDDVDLEQPYQDPQYPPYGAYQAPQYPLYRPYQAPQYPEPQAFLPPPPPPTRTVCFNNWGQIICRTF